MDTGGTGLEFAMAHWSSVDKYDGTNARATMLCVTSMKFTENGAGTYTGSAILPANALVYDVVVHAEALWAAGTSATLKIGDVADDDGFFTACNLKATDLLAAESISFGAPGGKQGADVDVDAAGAQHVRRRMLTTSRTVSAIVTSVGGGTTGRTWVHLLWAFQPTADIVTVTQ